MNDKTKTKEQLLKEIKKLRQRIAEFERLTVERNLPESNLRLLTEVVESASDGFQILDPEGRIIYANKATEEIHGFSSEELNGKHINELTVDPEIAIKEIIPAVNKTGTWEGKILTKHREGRHFPVWLKISLVKDENREPPVMVSIIRDISERKRYEERLQENEGKYRSLVESTEDSIYLVDRKYKYLFMNKKHISRLGLSDDEYMHEAFSTFHSSDETRLFIEKAEKVFETGESAKHEYRSLRDGRFFLQTLSPVKAQDGTTVAVTVVSKDITERKQMEEDLRTLSLTDELTNLYNRRGFFTMVEQQLKLAKRLKKGFSMLYADVNDLKNINDTLGHREGDLVLIEIAKILKDNYRESDIVARIGGDEFIVIPVGPDNESVDISADRLQKAIERHNKKVNRSYKVSLSFGIAHYDPVNPCSIDDLLVQADKSMYNQKRNQQP